MLKKRMTMFKKQESVKFYNCRKISKINNGAPEPTYLKLTLYKNYGKPTQTKEVKVIRLDEAVANYIISELKV